MSATTKLKALHMMQEANPHVFVAQSLAPILPQIARVLEAAERVSLRYGGPAYERAEELEAALAALDEALGD